MTPDRAIETAADYADALMTARRAKHTLVLVVLLCLVVQLTVFFLVRLDVIKLVPASEATTQPTTDWRTLLHYLVGMTTFLGLSFSIVLSLVLLLITNIMLVGRLIGVGRVTSAYIWCLVLVVLLFPWQAFLNNVDLTWDQVTYKIPGVLYTWPELTHPQKGANFPNAPMSEAFLKWSRFVGFPILAIVIVLAIQIKSSRGMRQALGEDLPSTSSDTLAGT
jgi:hypothetical protein